jgi:hypothetical protein
MAIVYELAWHGSPSLLGRWHMEQHTESLLALPGLAALDLYRPASGRAQDPYVDDGPGALALAMLEFADLEALGAALRHAPLFHQAAIDLPGGDRITVTGQAMRREFFPVAVERRPGPLEAPFSYVVRYYQPADDAAAFQRHYVQAYPPLQASFPAIRSIICYIPLAWDDPGGLPMPGYLIGNEVAFDSIAAFNLAMASEVRHALRRQFKDLPPFSGRNTHYPMDRTRLVG